ncbi:hypothetical protein [Pusillimonas noertemannii]|uniref:hypothetical protein n=1 Tax=Pusillimonas noertemannii TaxID=305977 RepID=UPI001AD8CB2C|nr:hypothetical protein [Pusillimonas noertemannii]
MPDNTLERIDRRDFMIASIATVGASAALVAGAATARETTAASANPSPGTVYTGEIQGKKSSARST